MVTIESESDCASCVMGDGSASTARRSPAATRRAMSASWRVGRTTVKPANQARPATASTSTPASESSA